MSEHSFKDKYFLLNEKILIFLCQKFLHIAHKLVGSVLQSSICNVI